MSAARDFIAKAMAYRHVDAHTASAALDKYRAEVLNGAADDLDADAQRQADQGDDRAAAVLGGAAYLLRCKAEGKE